MNAPLSCNAIAELLALHMSDLARELVGAEPTSRTRTELRFRRKGSLAVAVTGPKCGAWHDHEAGCGGDALGLIAHLLGIPMGAARAWALGWLGLADGAAERRQPRSPMAARAAPRAEDTRDAARMALARRLWGEAVEPAGTPVARYLAARGLDLPPDAPIRFHPSCPRGAERWPAMLALMTDPLTGEPCGVHRTFLVCDGRGKAPGQAKMMLGGAGVVRLVPDDEVTLGLGIAEGIETALAIMQGFGWRPVWAATSAGAIRTFPVLPSVAVLTIFADMDDRGAGLAAAQACTERWLGAGGEARIVAAPAGEDFADALRRCAA